MKTKAYPYFLAALLLAVPVRLAVAQTTMPWWWFDFAFPPGTVLPGQTESNQLTWAAAGPAGPPITITSNSLAVAGLAPPAGNRARLAAVNGPAARIGLGTNVNAGTIYYSLALRVADLGTLGTNGGVLTALNNATGASSNLPAPLAAGLGIRSTAGGYQLGVSATTAAANNFWDLDWWWCVYSSNQTVFLVCSYTFMPGSSNDVARLWFDPNPATFGSTNVPPPDSMATSTNDVNQISSFVLMQRPQPILPAVTFVDEVRVGPTWASVTPPWLDFGSAPDPSYSTLLASDGARHVVNPAIRLGAAVDSEGDAFDTADGDGVVFLTPLTPGVIAIVQVTASTAGWLDAFIDFNGDGVWTERITAAGGTPLVAGVNLVNFTVPSMATAKTTWARFRFSTTGGLAPTGAAADGEVEDYQVTIPAVPDPKSIFVIMDLHADPIPGTGSAAEVTYSNWVESSNWLLDQTEPRGAKVSFLTVGDFAEQVPAHPEIGRPLIRRLYASGGQVGTHSHNHYRFAPFDWRDLPTAPPHPTPAELETFWTNHLDMVDLVIRDALGVAAPADIRAINFVRGSGMPDDRVQKFDFMSRYGYTQIQQGECEEFYGYFAHHAMNPYRPSADRFLLHNPGGVFVDAPFGSVLGPNRVHFNILQDMRLPAVQARFLLEILNWLHDRKVANTERIWCAGWGQHCSDVMVGGVTRNEVVPMMDWFNTHFVGKPVGGLLAANWTSMGETARAYRSWETAHPGATSFSYAKTNTDWNLYPYLRPPSAYLTDATYKTNMPAVGTVRWHQVTAAASSASPFTIYIAYSTDGVPVTVDLSPYIAAPGMVAVDTVTGAGTTVATAAVSIPAKGVILVPAGNVLTLKLDFGDAPERYPVLLANNGARHVPSALRLGALVDSEWDGYPSANANGDDFSGSDDEEGVTFPLMIASTTANLSIQVAGVNGKLDAWFDWNRDGDWNDAGEHAVVSVTVTAGANTVPITIPSSALSGATYARFRLSTAGSALPTGQAADGEVEDYPVSILPNPIAFFGGLEHSRLGMANQLVSSNGLVISNLASSNDAVRIVLGIAEGWRGDIGQLTLANGPLNVALRGSIGGQTNRLVDSLRIERSGSNVLFSPNFAPLGATQYTAKVYDSSGTLLLSRAPTSAPFSVLAPCFDEAGNPGNLVCHTEVLFDSIILLVCECFEIPGLPPNTPGPVSVVLTPSDSTVSADFASAVEITGPSGSSLTLSGEALRQGGLWHQAVGDAHLAGALDSTGDYLALANLGTNGTDGIATEFGKQASVDVRIPNCPCEPNPSCCSTTAVAFRFLLDGTVNGVPAEMAYVTFIGEVPQGSVSGNFAGSGAASATLEVRNGTQLVGSILVGNGDWGTLTGTSNQPVSLSYGSFVKVDSNRVNLAMQFNYPVTFNAQAGGSFVGNNLRLRIANPNAVLNARAGALTIRGPAPVSVLNSIQDFGDAPDPNYPTKAASEGARHRFSLVSAYGPYLGPWYLGSRRDAEADAHANADATGDDITSFDDDDGISGIGGFTEGTTVTLTATASREGSLDGWIDYNGNGTWEDSEKILPSVHLDAGANTLTFTARDYEDSVFNGLVTFARFRFSKDGGLGPTGLASTGEVEDYQVFIAPKWLFFAGVGHSALGNAALTAVSNQLQVSNLGSSGQDGVAINLGASEGWQGRIEAPLRPAQAPNGSRLSWSLLGTVNGTASQPAAAGRMEVLNGAVNVFMDFSAIGASNNLVRAYINGEVVASNVVAATSPAFQFANGEWPPSLGIAWRKPIPGNETLITELTWNNGSPTCYVAIANGPVIAPDNVTITPLNATVQVLNLSKLNLLGQWPSGDLTIRDEAIGLLDHWHRGLGGALLDTSDTNDPPTLRVRHLGSNGLDGVETTVGRGNVFDGTAYELSIALRVVQAIPPDDWESALLTSSNSSIHWTARGKISNRILRDIGDLTFFHEGQGFLGLNARFDGIGATQAVVEVFDGQTLVGSFTTPVGLVGGVSSTARVSRAGAQVVDGSLVWSLKWDTRSAFIPPTGATLTGDRLRIAAVNPTMTVEGLRSLLTRGANVESLAFSGFNAATPQRPRLSAPRLHPGGLELPIPTEPDVTYDIERSASVNGPWTPIGRVMGTDGTNETRYTDTYTILAADFYRVRVR